MDKTLSTIGLCWRAGKLIYGFDAVAAQIKAKPDSVGGVLTASDLSEKTKKEVRFECDKYGIEVTVIAGTLDDIKNIIGKRTGVLAILDEGLYRTIVLSETNTH
jgi:ribosomal protein L7Ae-like RNA K-turn-binding protein